MTARAPAGGGLAGAFTEDRVRGLAAAALAASSADETEVRVQSRAGEYTRFARERIHQAQDITEWALTVRAVVHSPVGSHAASASTGDPDAVAATVARACAGARAQAAAGLPGRAHRVAAVSREASAGRQPEPLLLSVLLPEATGAFDVQTRSMLARHAMSAAAEHGGWAAGMISRAVTQLAVSTSAGVDRYTAAAEAGGSLTVFLDGGSSHWVDLDRDAGVLGVEAAIRATVAEAARARNPAPPPVGRYDVVLGPLAAGELVEALPGFGFTGAQLADGTGAVALRRGEQVAAAQVSVADDAHAPRGLPIDFDMEGTPKQVVTMLRDGRVVDAVTDLGTGGEAGGGSTGHAHVAREESPAPVAANLHLRPGTAGVGELVAGIERGLYIQRFWYTRVVDRAATTLTGVSRDACFAIVDGRLAGPVAGARFTESVFGALDRVDGVGAEVLSQPLMNVFNGAVTAPALRVRGFRFGAATPDPREERP